MNWDKVLQLVWAAYPQARFDCGELRIDVMDNHFAVKISNLPVTYTDDIHGWQHMAENIVHDASMLLVQMAAIKMKREE